MFFFCAFEVTVLEIVKGEGGKKEWLRCEVLHLYCGKWCSIRHKGHIVAELPSLRFEKCGNLKAMAALNDCVTERRGG